MSNARQSINVTIPLPPDVAAWLDDEARRRSMPRAALVRAWVTREMEGQTLERMGRLHEAVNEIRLELKKQARVIEEITTREAIEL